VPSATPAPAAPTVVHEPTRARPSELDPRDLPEPEPPKPAPTDHDQVVGHFGLGYFGQFDVPIGFPGLRKEGPTEAVQLVGVRYWWWRLRFDAAFGVNVQSGSQTVDGKSSDQPSTLVWGARFAIPIALYITRHYTLFAGPEVAFGRSGETQPGTEIPGPGGQTTRAPDSTHDGARNSVGARAGAEIQFGFIGIPQLSLDATIGLAFDITSGTTRAPQTSNPFDTSVIESRFDHTAFQSTLSHEPWNIFISNVAAVYYF
jgi:hypothetical protein